MRFTCVIRTFSLVEKKKLIEFHWNHKLADRKCQFKDKHTHTNKATIIHYNGMKKIKKIKEKKKKNNRGNKF